MSRENHTGTRKRESGASGAKSLDDRHDRVRKDNKKRRRRTARWNEEAYMDIEKTLNELRSKMEVS